MPAGKQYYRQTNWPVVITRSTDEKKKKDLQHFYIERDSRYKKKRVPIKVTQWPSKKWCSEISHPYHSSSSIDDRRRKNYDTLTLNAIRVSNLSESHYCMTKQKVVQWNLIFGRNGHFFLQLTCIKAVLLMADTEKPMVR